MKTIETGLKGFENLNVLLSVEGQLSDGIWENSKAMEKWWMNTSFRRDEEGNILLDYHPSAIYGRNYRELTDKEILSWFANRIKAIVKAEIKDLNEGDEYDVEWSRECNVKLKTMHDYHYSSSKEYEKHIASAPSAGRAYYVYDVLKGKDVSENSYCF